MRKNSLYIFPLIFFISSFVLLDYSPFFIHLAFISASLIYWWSGDLRTTAKKLIGKFSFIDTFKYVSLGYLTLILISFSTMWVLEYFNLNDSENVSSIVQTFSPYLVFLAVFVAPITEELFFRATLVSLFGVLPAAAIFGLLHFAYGSVAQIMVASLTAFSLSYIYEKSKSIVPVVLIHFLYNLTAILSLYFNAF